MLYINFVRLVTRKGRVKPGQPTVSHELFKFVLVIEIALFALCPEEQPALAVGARHLAFLQEGAKRSHACPRSDHDDWRTAIFRKMEFGFARKYRRRTLGATVGEKGRANAFAFSAMAFIGHDVDDEMHLVWIGFQARGDGVQTWLQFGQQTNEL